jgi:hypothetical protein
MAVNVPTQRRRCPRHTWCNQRGQGHSAHEGEVQVLATAHGTAIRLSLTADDDDAPSVHVEASLDEGGPMMDLAELAPAEATDLAGLLLRLARVTQVAENEFG